MGSVIQRSISTEILDKTMHVFWERGYFNTSVDDVIAATGLNKAALYKYFGDKHTLFLAMLQRYRETVTPQFIAPLRESHRGLLAIERFFMQFLNLNSNTIPCGCFLIATASELPSHDEQVLKFIQAFSCDLRQGLLACLTEAKKTQQLHTKVNIKAVADFLMVNLFGLMTLHRTKVTTNTIKHHLLGVKDYLVSLDIKNEKRKKVT